MNRLRLTFACWDYDRMRALADGSVRFISENINMDTFRFLATRDDGRVIGEY